MAKSRKADTEKLLRLWERARHRLVRLRAKADKLENGDDGIAFFGQQMDEAYKQLSGLLAEVIAACNDVEIAVRTAFLNEEEDL